MTKGPDGLWSVTTPPYEPGTHEYGFVIDGVPTGAFVDGIGPVGGGVFHFFKKILLLFHQFADHVLQFLGKLGHGNVLLADRIAEPVDLDLGCILGELARGRRAVLAEGERLQQAHGERA